MFRAAQLIGSFKARFGTRAISSDKLRVIISDQWYSTDPPLRGKLSGNIKTEGQWEARGLDKTQVTVVSVTSSGLHRSSDPYDHFTGRAFNDKGEAVWFFDTHAKFYTNGIHFYPNGLPASLDLNRFVETPSDDPALIAWCTANRRNIKTGRKI